MVRQEAEALHGQSRAPWAYTMEATRETEVWLTHPDNILEMDDQFYIWVSYSSSSSLIFTHTNSKQQNN
jgi:hypothetical protein